MIQSVQIHFFLRNQAAVLIKIFWPDLLFKGRVGGFTSINSVNDIPAEGFMTDGNDKGKSVSKYHILSYNFT